jgi:ABC-2 type transport system ATP-binding protein
VIEVERLSKHFSVRKPQVGKFAAIKSFVSNESNLIKAVDEVSFKINKGEIVGYLGPNGAGKSTTIKMLTGLLVPSSGRVMVNGHVPWKSRQIYVAKIGAVFGQRSTLWWDLPVIESLELLQHIYKIPNERFKHNLEDFKKILNLEEFLNTPARALSLGQRMRADLCAALLHDPELLFLDEPTIGLDVVAKERIREFILHINASRQTTVLLTTHDLADVQKLCKRVMIIDHGKLLFDGALEVLQNRFGGKRQLVVDFDQGGSSFEIPGASIVSRDGLRVVYAFSRDDISASELIRRLSERYTIQDLSVLEPEIEATIRLIYEQNLLGVA